MARAGRSYALRPKLLRGRLDPSRRARVFWAELELPFASAAVFPVTASDTITISDSLARTSARFRTATDTGATVAGDSIAVSRTWPRTVGADTGATITDSLAKSSPRAISDTGFSVALANIDKFNRADEDPVAGGIWSATPTDGGADGLRILSGQLAGDAGGGHGHTIASYGPDVTLGVILRAVIEDGTAADVLRARLQDVGTATYDGYSLRLQYFAGGGSNLTINRIVNGARTGLAPNWSHPTNFAADDELQLVVSGTGAAVALEAWYKPAAGSWSQVISLSDSNANRIVAAGPVGAQFASGTGRLDNLVTVGPPDSLAVTALLRGRTASDTITISDSLAASSLRLRATSDTGATITESVVVKPHRATVTDQGATVSDSIARTMAVGRTASDTGATVSDSIAAQRAFKRAPSDTGTTAGDSIAVSLGRVRTLADTGATVGDSIAPQSAKARTTSDTGATIAGDSIARAAALRIRTAADTGITISDSIAVQGAINRTATDTGATVSDSIVRNPDVRARTASDTGATVTGDSIARSAALRTRAATDTGATVTDALASLRQRLVADTGASVTDSIKKAQPRVLSDTGAVVSDTLASQRRRALADTLALSDSLARQLAVQRPVADTAASFSDSIIVSTGAGKAIVDTGATVSDALKKHVARTISETGAAISESLAGGRGYARTISDNATGGGVQTYSQVILVTPNVQHYWAMENATTVPDDAGGGAPASTVGSPSLSSGIEGNALSFTRSPARYLDIPALDSAGGVSSWAQAPLSLEAWFKRQAVDAGVKDMGIAGGWQNSQNGGPMLWVSFFTGGYSVTLGVGQPEYIETAIPPTDDAWDHLVATIDASENAVLYLNGASIGTRAGPIPGGLGKPGYFEIGRYNQDSNTNAIGFIDAVAHYSRVLTPSEVLDHYNAYAAPGGGAGITDAVVRSSLGRAASDTAATIASSIQVATLRRPSDTAATISDSILKSGVTQRAVVDTGATVTESMQRKVGRVLLEVGASITDSFVGGPRRQLVDIGAAITDALRPIQGRPILATGATVSDSLAIFRRRVLTATDAGSTVADSIARQLAATRSASDQGATISDSLVAVQNAVSRSASDQGATVTDQLVRSGLRRGLADTLAISDSITRTATHPRTATDTGASIVGDSIARIQTRGRTAADTGTTITETLRVPNVHRKLADTGATVVEAITTAGQNARLVTDTAAAVSDSLAVSLFRLRAISDTGATIASSIAVKSARVVSDQGATVSDSIQAAPARRASDQGAAVTDSIQSFAGRARAASDTAATVSDSIARAPATRPRTLSDQGASVTDLIGLVAKAALLDRAATITDSIATFSGTVLIDTAAVIVDTLYAYAKPSSVLGGEVELVMDEAVAELVLDDAALAELVYVPAAWIEQDEEPSVGVVILVP